MTDTGHARPVQLALAGCGALTRHVHAPSLRESPGVNVVALADPSEEALAGVANYFPRATTYPSLESMLEDANIDAVIVAMPTAQHATAATRVLEAGRHLYLEKPIATTMSDARDLVRAWRRTNLVGMMGFNYRQHPLYQQLRHQLGRNAIGEVVAVRTAFASGPGELPQWKTRRETGGGVLLDFAVHHIDLLRYLLAREFRTVQAEIVSSTTECDRADLQMTMDGNVLVQMQFAFGAVEEDRVEVVGTTGKLSVDRLLSVSVEHRPQSVGTSRMSRIGIGNRGPSLRSLTQSSTLLQKLRAPLREPSFAGSLAHFVDAVQRKTSIAPDLEDGLRALAVVDAAERSAASGERVTADHTV